MRVEKAKFDDTLPNLLNLKPASRKGAWPICHVNHGGAAAWLEAF